MEIVYFGTFAPMHRGHMNNVIYAKRKYQKVHIIVSGYENDRGDQANIDLQKRYEIIKKTYQDDPLVAVYMLDETNIPKIPNGWQEWLNQMKSLVPHLKEKTFICAEAEYKEMLVSFGMQVDLLTRDEIVISATKIRNNPFEYWDYINPSFRELFTKKVLITGLSNSGKTALARDLSLYFDGEYVSERLNNDKKIQFIDDNEQIKCDLNIYLGHTKEAKYINLIGNHIENMQAAKEIINKYIKGQL